MERVRNEISLILIWEGGSPPDSLRLATKSAVQHSLINNAGVDTDEYLACCRVPIPANSHTACQDGHP